MSNTITGDYDVIAAFTTDAIDRILAGMHAGGRFPHSLSMRVSDAPPAPQVHVPQTVNFAIDAIGNALSDPVLTRHLFDALPAPVTAYTAANQLVDPLVNNLGSAQLVTDYSLLSGVAQMQLGPPTIELPGDASATATFHTPVMVRYFPDPNSTALPEFMRGEVLTSLGVSEISAKGTELIDVGLAGTAGNIHFHQVWPTPPMPASQLDQVNLALKNSLLTSFQPANANLPQGVLNMQFKTLAASEAAVALMNLQGGNLTTGAVSNPDPGSVGAVPLQPGDDFAFAVSSDFILAPFNTAVNNALSGVPPMGQTIRVNPPDPFPGFNVTWSATVGTPTIQLMDVTTGSGGSLLDPVLAAVQDAAANGSGQVLLTIPVEVSIGTDSGSIGINPSNFTFTIAQAFTLSLQGAQAGVQLLTGLSVTGVPDPVDFTLSVGGFGVYTEHVHLGNVIGSVASQVFNQAWASASASIQSAVNQGASVSSLQGFLTGLMNQPGSSPLTPVLPILNYTSFEIHPAGLILHGQMFLALPFLDPVVSFDLDAWTANDPHPEYNALNTWIPGGTITSYLWSYGGKAQPPDPNKFVSSNAPSTVQRICLSVTGSRLSSSGPVASSTVTSVTICKPIRFPEVYNSFVDLQALLPNFAMVAAASDGSLQITGHTSPWITAGATTNLLVCFPADHDLASLAVLPRALTEAANGKTAAAALCVLAKGQLAKVRATPGLIFADDAKGWESLLKVQDRPAHRLLDPSGSVVWQHSGALTAVELETALKKNLRPGGFYTVRTMDLPLRVGQRAPNFIFAYPSGQQTTLRKLTGRPVLLVFWRSNSSASLQALDSLYEGFPAGTQPPIRLAVDDGEDSDYAHGLASHHADSVVIIPDPKRLISAAYGVRVWPTAVVLDAAGIIKDIRYGLEPKEQGK